ncbi:MAG: peptidase [Bacteroidetes bacterium]|nr:MAG: peptidase [Bacteroidota bacterium]
MSRFLPMFPLSLVVFPGENLRLHIFEPRYRQLVQECISEGLHFGIPPVVEQALMMTATEVELVTIDKRYPGGELDVTARGLSRVKVREFFREANGKLYPGADVEDIADFPLAMPDLREEVESLLQQLHDAVGIRKQYRNEENIPFSYRIGHHVGMNLRQEFELLGLPSESERLEFVRKHLLDILPVVMETERMKARAKLNGHYKNLLPPDY